MVTATTHLSIIRQRGGKSDPTQKSPKRPIGWRRYLMPSSSSAYSTALEIERNCPGAVAVPLGRVVLVRVAS